MLDSVISQSEQLPMSSLTPLCVLVLFTPGLQIDSTARPGLPVLSTGHFPGGLHLEQGRFWSHCPFLQLPQVVTEGWGTGLQAKE